MASLDQRAVNFSRFARQQMLLKDTLDCLKVELGRQIQHRHIFVVEALGGVGAFAVAWIRWLNSFTWAFRCRSRFICMKPVSWMNPGRPAVGAGIARGHGMDHGPLEHEIACFSASLSPASARRVSIGPPIRVIVRGCAGSFAAA